MIKLYTEKEFKDAKFKDKLKLQCEYCFSIFLAKKRHIDSIGKRTDSRRSIYNYCSRDCLRTATNPRITTTCLNCNHQFKLPPSRHKKSKNHFCSQSCAAKYNNLHKTKGTRCSKLEKWLQTLLPIKYPELFFEFNKKTAIESELDIYIPNLKLAFELNGIYHYEPIHGYKKLTSIQANDQNKMIICYQKEISLCVLDTSKMKYFKESSAKIYFEIISKIIDEKLLKT